MSIENRGIHYGLNVMNCLYWMYDKVQSTNDLHKTTIFMHNGNLSSGPIISFGVDINRFDIKDYVKESTYNSLQTIYPFKLKGPAALTWVNTVGSSFEITLSESMEIGKALVGKMWGLLSSSLNDVGVNASDLPNPIKTVLVSIIYESGKDNFMSKLSSHIASNSWYRLANAIEIMEEGQSKKYGSYLQKIMDKRYAQSQYIKAWASANAISARPDPLSSQASYFTTAKNMWEIEEKVGFSSIAASDGTLINGSSDNIGNISSISLCQFDKDANNKIKIYYKSPTIEYKEYSMGYPRQFKSKSMAAMDSLGRLTDEQANFLKDVSPYLPPDVKAVQGYRDPNEQAAIAIDMLEKLNMTLAVIQMPNNDIWGGDVASRMTGSYNGIPYPYIDWNSIQSTLKGMGIKWDLPGESLHQIGMALDFAVDKDLDINGEKSATAFSILNWFKDNHTKADEDGNLISYHGIRDIYYENNGAIQVEFINQPFTGIKGDGKSNGTAASSVVINDNTVNEIYRIFKENDFYDVKDSPHLTQEEKDQVPVDVQNDKSRLAKAIVEAVDYLLYGPHGAISVGVQSQFEYTQAKINGLASGIDTITSSVESLGAAGATSAVNSVEKVSAAASCTNPILSAAVLSGPAKDSVMKNAANWKAKLNDKLRGLISNKSASGYDSTKGSATKAGKQTVDASGSIVAVVPGNAVSPVVVSGYADTGDSYYSDGMWLGSKAKASSPQYDNTTALLSQLDTESTADHDRSTVSLLYKNGANYIKMDAKDGMVIEIKKSQNKYVIANHFTCTVISISKNQVSGNENLTTKNFPWKSGSYSAFVSYVASA